MLESHLLGLGAGRVAYAGSTGNSLRARVGGVNVGRCTNRSITREATGLSVGESLCNGLPTQRVREMRPLRTITHRKPADVLSRKMEAGITKDV
jgi:hypothetical protein